jgi:hypothetical protein
MIAERFTVALLVLGSSLQAFSYRFAVQQFSPLSVFDVLSEEVNIFERYPLKIVTYVSTCW